MAIDPKLLQWAASVLLILSGVQNLVGVNVHRSVAASLRTFSMLISLAAIAIGVVMIINLVGVRT